MSLKAEAKISEGSPEANNLQFSNTHENEGPLGLDPIRGWIIGSEYEGDFLRSIRGTAEVDEESRSSIEETIEVLDLLIEGPFSPSEDWTEDTLNWLTKHGYARFVSYSESQDVGFRRRSNKDYRIK